MLTFSDLETNVISQFFSLYSMYFSNVIDKFITYITTSFSQENDSMNQLQAKQEGKKIKFLNFPMCMVKCQIADVKLKAVLEPQAIIL